MGARLGFLPFGQWHFCMGNTSLGVCLLQPVLSLSSGLGFLGASMCIFVPALCLRGTFLCASGWYLVWAFCSFVCICWLHISRHPFVGSGHLLGCLTFFSSSFVKPLHVGCLFFWILWCMDPMSLWTLVTSSELFQDPAEICTWQGGKASYCGPAETAQWSPGSLEFPSVRNEKRVEKLNLLLSKLG